MLLERRSAQQMATAVGPELSLHHQDEAQKVNIVRRLAKDVLERRLRGDYWVKVKTR